MEHAGVLEAPSGPVAICFQCLDRQDVVAWLRGNGEKPARREKQAPTLQLVR